MKFSLFGFFLAAALLVSGSVAQAQYKAPSQYFRKDSPGVNPGGRPGTPNPPAQKPPGVASIPKFKDLEQNTQFFFTSDTNRAIPWMKLSATTAKNTKSGLTQTINGETPIRR